MAAFVELNHSGRDIVNGNVNSGVAKKIAKNAIRSLYYRKLQIPTRLRRIRTLSFQQRHSLMILVEV